MSGDIFTMEASMILEGDTPDTPMLIPATDAAATLAKNVGTKGTRGAPKTKKERVSRPRPPARPHRKLDGDTLGTRIKDLEKKLSVLRSRIILLDDRLDAYKREYEIRTG